MKLTAEEIEAGKTPAGGYTKAQLAEWGVSWPPVKGWKEALLAGETVPETEPFVPEPVTDEEEKWARALFQAFSERYGDGVADPDSPFGNPPQPRWRSFVDAARRTMRAVVILNESPAKRT